MTGRVPPVWMKMDNNVSQLTPERLSATIESLGAWVEEHEYRGYEPFDGLSSWLRPLAFGQALPLRLLQQFVRQSPFNVRPLVGVRPQESTKGRGYMAWGYLALYQMDRRPALPRQGRRLPASGSTATRWRASCDHSWSNHFDFASRGGTYTRNDPIIVWTSLIGHAYVEAFEATGKSGSSRLRRARATGSWISRASGPRAAIA